MVTPLPGSYAFSPAFQKPVNVPPSVPGQNFTGIPTQHGNAVLPLRQFSPPWKSQKLGTTSLYINDYGCLLTDWAMLLNYWGAKTNGFYRNPFQLNSDFVSYKKLDGTNGQVTIPKEIFFRESRRNTLRVLLICIFTS